MVLQEVSRPGPKHTSLVALPDQGGPSPSVSAKPKKRKVAILFGYLGGAYHGLQRQNGPVDDAGNCPADGIKTIEDEIVRALVLAKAIPEEHAKAMKKMSFQRAARTDKGVSAVANLVSLKLWMIDGLKDKLNNLLPRDIRVFEIVRVCQGFDSKKTCESRTYSYLLPAYCLIDVSSRGGVVTERSLLCPDDNPYDRQSVERARSVLDLYLGAHNFHNFTSGKRFCDPSCVRNILSVELSDPFFVSLKDITEGADKNGQYCLVNIKGQSFMLHQIRKMITVMVYAARGLLPGFLMSKRLFESDRIAVVRAPANGLYLHSLHYDRYNTRYANDGSHESLAFTHLSRELADFRDNVILPDVIERCYAKDTGANVFLDWLAYSIAHPIDFVAPRSSTIWLTGVGRAHVLANSDGASGDLLETESIATNKN